MDLVSFFQGGY